MSEKTKNWTLREIMQKEVFTLYPSQTIFDAAVLMASKDIGIVPVVKDDETLVGILTDRDIVTRCTAIGKDPRRTKIYECMSSNPIRTVPSVTTFDAIMLMSEYGVRRLPIVENDKLAGFISISDIASVSDFCPNKKTPDESCILLDMAKELKRTSHCHECCDEDFDD